MLALQLHMYIVQSLWLNFGWPWTTLCTRESSISYPVNLGYTSKMHVSTPLFQPYKSLFFGHFSHFLRLFANFLKLLIDLHVVSRLKL